MKLLTPRHTATALLLGGLLQAPLALAKGLPQMEPPVRWTLQEVLARGENGGHPFVVIDKQRARLWLFAANGKVMGQVPVLLGLARGDDTEPGIGDLPLDQIQPHQRTTPAGRFLSEHGRNTHGEDVIWVDYDAAVSMHRVRATNPSERRLQRLTSRTANDNRISWGCINVPAAFYDRKLLPALRGLRAMVYVLPETRALTTLFASP